MNIRTLTVAAYSLLATFTLCTVSILPVCGQTSLPPSVAETALATVDGISGVYTTPTMPTNRSSMPYGPVMGNGDVGVVFEGAPNNLRFGFGKSDFFGVLRGGAMPVGSLNLNIPELEGATYNVSENIGPATLTGKFVASQGASCALSSWVAATSNVTVIQLHNSGSIPLTVTDRMLDGFGTDGNSATYGTTPTASGSSLGFTWLRVSPDIEHVDLGNRLHGGTPEPFNGRIADVNVYASALPAAALSNSNASPSTASFYSWHGEPDVKVLGSASIEASQDHGAPALIDGSPQSAVELGVMRLPQSQLTVTAWIKVTAISQEESIFTALGDPYRPRKYPYERGVELELVNGCLSGKLNTTSVTSVSPVPVGQWVKVALVYDGEKMSLYADGVQVASTTDFPTTADVNGYDQSALHFGDQDLPYDGDGPDGIMVQRVVGSIATANGRALGFTIPVNSTATILLSIETDRNSKNYWNEAVQSVTNANIPLLTEIHDAWWRAFWSKSFVNISDAAIERYWYGSLYLYACCSRSGCSPPGLWGNFIDSPDSVCWQGDYTLDYNAEAPPWAAYATNHWELADNYEDPLIAYMPRGKAIAAHNGYQGLSFYTHLIPGPGWDDDPSKFLNQQCGILFGCVDCAMRWKLTGDVAYARTVYPLLKGTADFWDDYLKLENGQYVDNNDATDEFNPGATNPATSIAFLNLLYPTLIDMSTALGVDADMRSTWQNIYTHLSPLPIVKAATIDQVKGYPDDQTLGEIVGAGLTDDKLAIRDSLSGTGFPRPEVLRTDDKERSTSAGMNSTQSIFPGWDIGMESSDSDREAALETVTLASEWFDGNDDCTFYPAAAIAGYDPSQILLHLNQLIKDHSSPSFVFHSNGGGVEDVAIIPVTLSEMFQQSFQGSIHVFPNWPTEDDASFGNIPTCGGFLLASSLKAGQIQYVEITSEEGNMCILANPWPDEKVELFVAGKKSAVLAGSQIKFPTIRGETVLLEPV